MGFRQGITDCSTDRPDDQGGLGADTLRVVAVGGYRDERVRYRAEDCSGCALKEACTAGPRHYLYRHVHYAALQRMTVRERIAP
jgi:hypothetical protein